MSVLSPAEFTFPTRLDDATVVIGETNLSRVAMINDRRFPWGLIVPRVLGVEEFYQLSSEHRGVLMDEISALAEGMTKEFDCYRVNVADIGNRVSQLHVHVVARQTDDALWPQVVWSQPRKEFADPNARRSAVLRLNKAAANIASFTTTERKW